MAQNRTEGHRPRRARVCQQGVFAGDLEETKEGDWSFAYAEAYTGLPISLTMPVRTEPYEFTQFPPVFEGLLPEGVMRDALLRRLKIDKDDYFAQLIAVGADLVGSITVCSPETSKK